MNLTPCLVPFLQTTPSDRSCSVAVISTSPHALSPDDSSLAPPIPLELLPCMSDAGKSSSTVPPAATARPVRSPSLNADEPLATSSRACSDDIPTDRGCCFGMHATWTQIARSQSLQSGSCICIS
ncbi:hypothetical protein VTN96DRAFT_8760 [Rasamsonia emersonii]